MPREFLGHLQLNASPGQVGDELAAERVEVEDLAIAALAELGIALPTRSGDDTPPAPPQIVEELIAAPAVELLMRASEERGLYALIAPTYQQLKDQSAERSLRTAEALHAVPRSLSRGVAGSASFA